MSGKPDTVKCFAAKSKAGKLESWNFEQQAIGPKDVGENIPRLLRREGPTDLNASIVSMPLLVLCRDHYVTCRD